MHKANSDTADVLFQPRIYNETLKLLLEAHQYFDQHGQIDQVDLTDKERTLYCCEMSRITMRLSCVMAWLMTRKAVLAGKISAEEALAKYRLDCREVCLFQNSIAEPFLPKFVSGMLLKTFSLYQRVARLDDQLVTH